MPVHSGPRSWHRRASRPSTCARALRHCRVLPLLHALSLPHAIRSTSPLASGYDVKEMVELLLEYDDSGQVVSLDGLDVQAVAQDQLILE